MENMDWTTYFCYEDEYINRFFDKANAIHQEKGDQATYQDFSVVDIIHPGRHEGIDKFFSDYPQQADYKILEVGCGLGGTSRYLHYEKGVNIFGFDYVSRLVEGSVMINRWLSIEDKVQHVQGDACTFPHEPSTYDCAFAVGVFVHIDSDEGILNTCRALKPGGLFYNEDYYFVKDRSEFTDEDRNMITKRHLYGTKTKAEMRDLLERANMEIVEMSEFGTYWSREAWARANRCAQGHKDGTNPLPEKYFEHHVRLAPLLTYDFDIPVEEIRTAYPALCEYVDAEEVILRRPKLASVYRVVARKRA